jgi:hypothetical protein
MAVSLIENTLINVKVRGTASGAITAGDLVSNYETGVIAKVNATLGVQVENNTTQGLSAIKVPSSLEGTAAYGQATNDIHQDAICELATGNIAFIYTGNGATDNTNLNLRIKTPLDGDIIAKVTVSTDTSINFQKVIKISSTQFAVIWNTGSALKCQIFNNNGTTSGATFTVDTLAGSNYLYWNATVLANGNIVFVYNQITTTNTVFKVYNAAGAVVVAATTIGAGDSATSGISVLGCSNGDFVVMYYRSTATAALKIARYTSAGAAVGSIQSSASYLMLNYANFSDLLIELTGGNVVALLASNGTSYPAYIVLSSTHTVVKTFTQLSSAASTLLANEAPAICSIPNGNFVIIGRNTTNNTKLTLMIFDSSGGGVLTKTDAGGASPVPYTTIGQGSGVSAFLLGAIGFATFRTQSDGTNYCGVLDVMNMQGVSIGSIVIAKVANTNTIYWRSVILAAGGILIGMFKEGGNIYLQNFYYNCFRRSIIGVSTDTVADGAAVNVFTKGNYTINQTLANGGNFDNTTTVVAGTKGSVVGNTAILRGTL